MDETGIELAAKPNSQTQGHWAKDAKELGYTPRYKHPARINAFAGVAFSQEFKLLPSYDHV